MAHSDAFSGAALWVRQRKKKPDGDRNEATEQKRKELSTKAAKRRSVTWLHTMGNVFHFAVFLVR